MKRIKRIVGRVFVLNDEPQVLYDFVLEDQTTKNLNHWQHGALELGPQQGSDMLDDLVVDEPEIDLIAAP